MKAQSSQLSPNRNSWRHQYESLERGACAYFGCAAKAAAGHSHCRQHLAMMSNERRRDVRARKRQGRCVDCGARPQFWGVRCILCRQRCVKDSDRLPTGALRALRLYKDAERMLAIEQQQAKARFEIRKLLAMREVEGAQAKALRLYAGVDDGVWRSHAEVGRLMHLSRERVRQLLAPFKTILSITPGH